MLQNNEVFSLDGADIARRRLRKIQVAKIGVGETSGGKMGSSILAAMCVGQPLHSLQGPCLDEKIASHK